jgi:hypothetical protein
MGGSSHDPRRSESLGVVLEVFGLGPQGREVGADAITPGAVRKKVARHAPLIPSLDRRQTSAVAVMWL